MNRGTQMLIYSNSVHPIYFTIYIFPEAQIGDDVYIESGSLGEVEKIGIITNISQDKSNIEIEIDEAPQGSYTYAGQEIRYPYTNIEVSYTQLYLQWNQLIKNVVINKDSTATIGTINFPSAFPHACWALWLSGNDLNTILAGVSKTTSSVIVRGSNRKDDTSTTISAVYCLSLGK